VIDEPLTSTFTTKIGPIFCSSCIRCLTWGRCYDFLNSSAKNRRF
jgi:hypothetical protein